MAKGKALVSELIKTKKVLMVSKSYCPYCAKAKSVLKLYKLNPEDYEILEIDGRPDMDEIQNYMQRLTGARSMPRVFIGGKCIGGGDETVAAHKNKTLGAMLEQAGALQQQEDE